MSEEPEQPAALTTCIHVSNDQKYVENGAYRIVDHLSLWAVHGVRRNYTTAVHDASSKKWLAFIDVVSIVQ